jgi:membrane protein YqaA with SNARE-associated domain
MKSEKDARLKKAGLTILRLLALAVVIGITVFIYSIRDRVEEFAAFGYPTIILPAPGVAVVFAMGGVFHPLGVALAAATGGTLGELTGYLAGFSGQAVVERAALYQRMTGWVRKYGPLAVTVLAAIPNPFFDLAGIAAGALKMPVWKFLLFCWLGQLIKMSLFAVAGHYSLTWLTGLLNK